MTDFSRQTGHVATIKEIPHQKWQRGFAPTYEAVCETCDWSGAERQYRQTAVRDAASHVDQHRGVAPAWSTTTRRR